MNVSELFIKRPVATSLLMAAILLTGLAAFGQLPIATLPEVEYPTIEVQTFYPGASPEVMTSSVTAPLETQLSQQPGIDRMISTSSAGASIITLQFSLGLSLDVAEQEVQAAINAAGNLLPADLPTPPIYSKVNPADAPILTLALTSKSLPLIDLQELAETRLAPRISQQAGVGRVSIGGGNRPAVRVRLNPRALAAYGLAIDDVRTILDNQNVNTPKGFFDGPDKSYTINANDRLTSAEQYAQIVVAHRNGNPVKLSDVAEVLRGPENAKLAAWSDETPAIIVDVRRQPGANVINVVDSIKALLPQLEASLPGAVDVRVISDRTTTIRASVEDVELELVFAVVLVVLVIFLFLRTFAATIIPSLSAPLSLVGCLGVMYLLHFSLDNLSLMALTIATGFVVDDAIVMIENIARYVEAGMKPMEAALKGAGQIGFTIVSLTISLIAVLIPLLFMRDLVGRLFHEFAITLTVTIVISAVVSLTLVPMMCARLIHHRPDAERSRLDLAAEHGFDWIIALYGRALEVVLRHQPLTLFVAVATMALTVLLYAVIPKGFFPVQDTGLVQAISVAPQDVSFAEMARLQTELAKAILKDPDVETLSSFVGVDGVNPTVNNGRFLIALKPLDKRSGSATQIIRRLESEVAGVTGASLYMQPVQDITIDASVTRAPYKFVVEDLRGGDLQSWVPALTRRLAEQPELTHVASDLQHGGLAIELAIDRATASRFGVTPATIDNALYDSFGQRVVSTIYTHNNQYRVILEADSSVQTHVDGISAIYLPSSTSTTNGQVPLGAVAHVAQRAAPLLVSRFSQFPAATISFDLSPGAALGDAARALQNTITDMQPPRSLVIAYQGALQAFQSSLTNQLLLILASVAAMYIVLGVLYESYIHPITILSTLPSAGVGALITLILFGYQLDIISIIGIILLIGIVKKNAIMMIDFALDAERDEGKTPREAIFQACLLRFRPILMTTMAAILGAMPLMLGAGAGSELRRPLGFVIVGGLVVSQVLTLFTTPVIYLYFDRLARRLGAGRASEASP